MTENINHILHKTRHSIYQFKKKRKVFSNITNKQSSVAGENSLPQVSLNDKVGIIHCSRCNKTFTAKLEFIQHIDMKHQVPVPQIKKKKKKKRKFNTSSFDPEEYDALINELKRQE